VSSATIAAPARPVAGSRPQTPATARELAAVWRGLRRRDIFPLRPPALLAGLAGRRDHLVSGHGLRRLAARHLQITRQEQASSPLHLIAYDLLSGQEVRLSGGPAIDAVLAAAAIPGLLPPIRSGSRLLADGGVANNTPISHAIQLGAERIYVLPTGDPGAASLAPAALRRTRRSSPRTHHARRHPPASRPDAIRHRSGTDRPARRQPPAHTTHQLHPRQRADRTGARGRQDSPGSP
jgi:predicted acylesterase/phospholipase RssA